MFWHDLLMSTFGGIGVIVVQELRKHFSTPYRWSCSLPGCGFKAKSRHQNFITIVADDHTQRHILRRSNE